MTTVARILQPEVTQSWYAFDRGYYWRVEILRSGRPRSTRLPRPPAGQPCRFSDDGFATYRVQTIPASGSRTALAVLGMLASFPLVFGLLSGSTTQVRLLGAFGVSALFGLQALFGRMAALNPRGARRLAALSVVQMTLHHRGRARGR